MDRSEYVATHDAMPPTHSAASVSGSASSSLTHDASAVSQSSSSSPDLDDDSDVDGVSAGLSPPFLRRLSVLDFTASSCPASPSSRDAQRYTSPPSRDFTDAYESVAYLDTPTMTPSRFLSDHVLWCSFRSRAASASIGGSAVGTESASSSSWIEAAGSSSVAARRVPSRHRLLPRPNPPGLRRPRVDAAARARRPDRSMSPREPRPTRGGAPGRPAATVACIAVAPRRVARDCFVFACALQVIADEDSSEKSGPVSLGRHPPCPIEIRVSRRRTNQRARYSSFPRTGPNAAGLSGG